MRIRDKAILIFALAMAIIGLVSKLRSVSKDNDRLYNNYYAAEAEKDSLSNIAIQYELKIEELKYSNDSVNSIIKQKIDSLNIKYSKVKQVAYIKSQAIVIDTIRTTDTIFRDSIKLDTIITDAHRTVKVHMEYPNVLGLDIAIPSEKTLIWHTHRYIPRPSKIFFIRWFQRRKTRVEVEIVESNPYIRQDKSRFINITE